MPRTVQIHTPWGREYNAPFVGRASLQYAVDLLTAVDVGYLDRHPNTPSVYDAGVVYQREPRTIAGMRREDWLSTPHILQRGVADCEDLSAAVAAELQVEGIAARAVVIPVSGGYHVVVRYPNGRVEDPSARLGMRF